jgi:maleamate amidohydrolase
MTIEQLVAEVKQHYAPRRAPGLEPGTRPAVLVVDFARGWTDPDSPMAASLDSEVGAAAQLLRHARRHGTPVILTTVAYRPDEAAATIVARKSPWVSCLQPGSPWTEIDPRLEVEARDLVILKKHSSAFFATDLASQLIIRRVDTLFVCGCVTSGCVRATVVDAAQYGFLPIVVRDAVGDRSRLAHEANLLDIEQRYGEVVTLDAAMAHLSSASVSSIRPAIP